MSDKTKDVKTKLFEHCVDWLGGVCSSSIFDSAGIERSKDRDNILSQLQNDYMSFTEFYSGVMAEKKLHKSIEKLNKSINKAVEGLFALLTIDEKVDIHE